MPTPYLPNTDTERAALLKEIGVSSVDELFADIPGKFLNVQFKLPAALSEIELQKKLYGMSARNADLQDYSCFLGAGHYRHFIPGVVREITGRSEFYTPYTPYQAEVSQGTLQAMYEYQSLICQLTGMEISNAGLYDGGSAAAEAALMACRITKKRKISVIATINPKYLKVISTYARGQDIPVEVLEAAGADMPPDSACLIAQQPNFYGSIENIGVYAEKAHKAGALLIVVVTPLALALYQTPAAAGADIIVGEAQSLGNPLSFGGPGLGIFACKQEYLRQMPGRIVGRTQDTDGRPGYVLTIATREQHIKRERATSNICTNQALVALATTVYLAAMGKKGLRQVAELCYHKAHYAAGELGKLKGYSLPVNAPFFNEFVLRCPSSPNTLNEALMKEKIVGGLDISHLMKKAMLVCVTEVNTKDDIDRFVQVAGRF